MIHLLLLAVGIHQLWYSVPLIAVISLVYAATRHEYLRPILTHATSFAVWVIVFMLAILALLAVLSLLA